jgi:hypothetical protein
MAKGGTPLGVPLSSFCCLTTARPSGVHCKIYGTPAMRSPKQAVPRAGRAPDPAVDTTTRSHHTSPETGRIGRRRPHWTLRVRFGRDHNNMREELLRLQADLPVGDM